MSIGVLSHIDNPSFDDVAHLAAAAEEAGADWLGLADAFWWHDGWMLLGHAAGATRRIELGLAVTNPYLRHPFHTIAAIASAQAIAGPRVFLGLAAGGSEVTDAAGIPRRDAARRITELVDRLRAVSSGEPLDPRTGRTLATRLELPPVLVAGRGDQVLRTAGAVADRVLLWAVPRSDLVRSIGLVREGARQRTLTDPPEIIWAPVVDHDGSGRARRTIAYAALNSHPQVHARWGLDAELLARIRAIAVREHNEAASDLVPSHVVDDIVLDPRAGPAATAETARLLRDLGIGPVAVRGSDPATVAAHVDWARALLADVSASPGHGSTHGAVR